MGRPIKFRIKNPPIRIANRCMLCGKIIPMNQSIDYCDSFLDFAHGLTTKMCKNCYKKKLLKTIADCKKMLKTLKK
jgi:hypothetical protein